MSRVNRASAPQGAAHVPSFTTLRRLLGYRLRRATMLVQSDLAETLKPFGLRMITFSALVLIRDNPGLSQSQLAAAMDVERPNLVVIVDELETRGLIARDRLATDRRTYALTVTEAGDRLCADVVAAVEAHEARLFDGLTEAERQTVEAALALIHRNAKG
ncbi:MarR family winged helix-turn-helix transcriptional regulator [Roseicyclus amphidinii]|uniref:MarR family winged helix-turn-helix transcriptional regulator n=1 Tax=Roseicyclus amphidinii TaxID=3034232 RepID=UPI0024E0F8A4|nr:MarR family transcriptional regulator [Roseicyclus sp. Amp-Y-6]